MSQFLHSAAPDPLRAALLDSRARWRDLVDISCDLAFETDAAGRLAFVSPDPVLQWPADDLLGRPAALLLPQDEGPRFNPFVVSDALRDCRVWLRQADSSLVWMSMCAAPLFDQAGAVVGARGTGRDITRQDQSATTLARDLRRSAVVDHIMARLRGEVLASRMLRTALSALAASVGAEGAVVLRPEASVVEGGEAEMGAPVELVAAALPRLGCGGPGSVQLRTGAGHAGVLAWFTTRFEPVVGLLAWRAPGGRGWDGDELALVEAATAAVRLALEQEAVQREMAHQARTDPLTGLPNRRAFIEDLELRLRRAGHDGRLGALLFVDLDGLKVVNDRHGHDAGDEMLRAAGLLLRGSVRPMDLVGRLGGDEFALWLDGMDGFAAAERADQICAVAPGVLGRRDALVAPERAASLSIGIACPEAEHGVDGATLLRRADEAMYAAKAAGGGGWRMARRPGAHG